MKRIAIVIILVLNIIVVCAQNAPIGSFYGMKLGDSRSAVEAGVRSQGKTGEWRHNKSNNTDFYYVTNPTLGSVKFGYGKFSMTDNKLSAGEFITRSTVTECDWKNPSDIEYDKKNSQSAAEEKFQLMRNSFVTKYGNPAVDTGERCVWQTGKNKLILQYRVYTDYDVFQAFGTVTRTPQSNYEVSVRYIASENQTNSNF